MLVNSTMEQQVMTKLYTPKLMAGHNQMSYGGHGGGFTSLQDTGGQSVRIKSGDRIDSIQIGNNLYGGNGGGNPQQFQLPQNGAFTLMQLSMRGDVIGFIRLKCLGTEYTSGVLTGEGDISFGDGLQVTFAGISAGSFVDLLLFNII